MSPEQPEEKKAEIWPEREPVVIPSDQSLIDGFEAASVAYLERLGFDQDQREKFGMSVREALANAMHWGNDYDPKKNVTITSAFDEREAKVTVSITDEGGGFDPEKIPDPLAEENLLEEHGRGVLLIKSFCEDVHFSDGGRTVTFSMRKKE